MKYKQLITSLTLEEKASLMSGKNFWNTKPIDRLNIPSIMLTDGPHGLRKQGGKADHLGLNKSLPATCFPTAATLANSWDKELLYNVGSYLGLEAVSENVSVLLGPGLNIKRNPLCGRNFEYFSEDPHLTGALASEMVKGIQSQKIAACPKHYAVNSQEHMRMTIDEIVDERSLREIYLEAFRKVVMDSEPKTIMTAYNKVNGEYANENYHLLQDILYHEWEFKGVVVTDWGGNNDRVTGLLAGNQLEMPSTNGITDREIIEAVKRKEIPETVLDQAVNSVLELIFSTKQEDRSIRVDYEKHHELAVDAAKRSIVLLKNTDEILPLATGTNVAIIGDFAKVPRYQGAGSSLINPIKQSNALDVLTHSALNVVGYGQGFKRMGGKSKKLLNEAIALSQQADVVLLFLGLDEGSEAEGVDRKHLRLHDNQLLLLKQVARITPNIVVVLAGGGVIEMPFVHQVKGIVHTYLAGQGSAEALKSILLGEYNPSGRLSETFPVKYEDVPSAPYFPGKEATSEHREGLFIGYRYFDTANVAVLYPFGYGLSYTTFTYEDLEIDQLKVSFNLINTGKVAGEEIAQLYIEKKNSQIFRAKRELKGFKKVFLDPGQCKKVVIELAERDFSYFNTEVEAWVIESGVYEIQIGSSIADIRLREPVQLNSNAAPAIYSKEKYPHYFEGNVHEVGDQEFYDLLGYHPPASTWDKEAKLGMNDTINQAKYKNWLGKAIYHLIMLASILLNKINKPLAANNMYFILNMPFRQIERLTGGKISRRSVELLLKLINR